MMYDVIGVLGSGSCAVVSLAAAAQPCDDRPSLVAIKSPKYYASSRMIERESSILRDFRGCPEIIQCFGNTTDSIVDNNGDVHKICDMYMEYVPYGSLETHIKFGPLTEKEVRDYTKSLLNGLSHVHRNGYVHCDIKPANILVSGPADVKITDFGLAKVAGYKAELLGEYGIRCTPRYMAPECVTHDEYEPPLDIWSLGCTVVEMFTGKPAIAFGDDYASDLGEFLKAIGNGIAVPEIPETLSELGKDFLKLCFIRVPELRWSVEMLLDHPFVSGTCYARFACDSESESNCPPIGCGNRGEDAQLDINSMIAMLGI